MQGCRGSGCACLGFRVGVEGCISEAFNNLLRGQKPPNKRPFGSPGFRGLGFRGLGAWGLGAWGQGFRGLGV